MPITAECPACKKVYQVPESMAGKRGKCTCGATFAAPALPSAPPVPSASSQAEAAAVVAAPVAPTPPATPRPEQSSSVFGWLAIVGMFLVLPILCVLVWETFRGKRHVPVLSTVDYVLAVLFVVVSALLVPLLGGACLLLGCKIARIKQVSYVRCWKAYLSAYLGASLLAVPLLLLWHVENKLPSLLMPALMTVGVLGIHFTVVPWVLRAPYLRAVLAHALALFFAVLLLALLAGPPLYFVVAPLVQASADSAASTVNLLRIGAALRDYEDANQTFPPPAITSSAGQPLLSWRVALLPYLEEEELYRQFHLNEPWDSAHNGRLLDQMPKVYAAPGETNKPLTRYRVFVTQRNRFPHSLFVPGNRINRASVSAQDGASNTLAVVEAAEPVPWTKPDELPFDPDRPLPKVVGHARGKNFLVLFADGSVRPVRTDLAEQDLRALITVNGGELVGIGNIID